VRYHPVAFLDAKTTPQGYSTRAANAAICAAEAGVFTAYQDKLLTERPSEDSAGLSDQKLIAMGQEVGAPGTFAQCVSASQHSKAIADETARVINDTSLRAPGASSAVVPAVVVNGSWTDYSKTDWLSNRVCCIG
jgi:protein-disulfide isomerase